MSAYVLQPRIDVSYSLEVRNRPPSAARGARGGMTLGDEMAGTGGPHLPVLREEVLSWLAPRPGGRICDATVGYGGHARAILDASAPDGRLIGLDRDRDALEAARSNLASHGDRVTLVHAPFSRLAEVLAQAGALPLDGCLVDLGVSSPQLDRGERGFSFRRPGPLDMRMDQSSGETASQYLGRVSEQELTAVLRDFGEERFARRIAGEIVAARDTAPITTTDALAAIVTRAIPKREHHKDPATRTFQALRIAVNRELEELERFLADVPGCLAPGGRLVVIAFHSLEDRMVKRRLRQLSDYPGGRGPGDVVGARPAGEPRFEILTKKPVTASDAELAANPRARSAKLRAAVRAQA
jgi:16S rRNA (cytosine1402-N4)-methyltransferase